MKKAHLSYSVLVGFGVLLLTCSCYVLRKTCSEGQHLNLTTTICESCPYKQYMSEKNHTNEACIPCTIYDATYNVQKYEGCSSVSNNHITKCFEGYYIKDGECNLCPLCSSDNRQPECCEEQTSTSPPVAETTSTPGYLNVTVRGSGTTAISSTGVSTTNPSYRFNKTDSTKTESDSAYSSIIIIIIACVVAFVVILIFVVIYLHCYKKKRSEPTHNTNEGALIKQEVSNGSVQKASRSVQLLKPEC